MTIATRILTLLLTLLLTSCAYVSPSSVVQNRDKHYLSARSTAPLRVPPGLSANGFRNYYPVSNQYYSDAAKEVSIIPPGLND